MDSFYNNNCHCSCGLDINIKIYEGEYLMKGWVGVALIIVALIVGYYVGEKKPGMFQSIGL